MNLLPASDYALGRLQHRVSMLFQALDYDFSSLTIESFVRWVEKQQGGRRIECKAWPLPASVSGAWLATPTCDYIFFPADVHPLHRTHILLHELAHMLCGHRPILWEVDARWLMAGRMDRDVAWGISRSMVAEWEAEYLATAVHTSYLYGGKQCPGPFSHWPDTGAVLDDLLYLGRRLGGLLPTEEAACTAWCVPAETVEMRIYQTVIQIMDCLRWIREPMCQGTEVPPEEALRLVTILESNEAMSYEQIVDQFRRLSCLLRSDPRLSSS
jgi:hypothetical protein